MCGETKKFFSFLTVPLELILSAGELSGLNYIFTARFRKRPMNDAKVGFSRLTNKASQHTALDELCSSTNREELFAIILLPCI